MKFVMSERLQSIDPMGEDHIYEIIDHPTASDLVVVHIGGDKEWRTALYEKKEVKNKFKEGHWIKL